MSGVRPWSRRWTRLSEHLRLARYLGRLQYNEATLPNGNLRSRTATSCLVKSKRRKTGYSLCASAQSMTKSSDLVTTKVERSF